jgi:hypothetical protein
MLAVLCGLVMLTLQLSHYYHSLTDAVDYIITTSERRTYGNQQELIKEYNASKNTTFMDILVKYSTAVAVDLKHMSNGLLNQVQIRFLSFFWYFFIAALCLPVIRKRMATGLFIAMILSLTGPLGWFIIFKYHAISHTHMNFILWYMPLMLFGPVFVGYICHQLVILSIAKVNQFIHLRKL